MIDTRQLPKALITDFGFSNAARRMNVEYSRSWGFTPGYVRDSSDITPWDPSSDVYAFGVTCCQVCSDSATAIEYFSEYGTMFRLPW